MIEKEENANKIRCQRYGKNSHANSGKQRIVNLFFA